VTPITVSTVLCRCGISNWASRPRKRTRLGLRRWKDLEFELGKRLIKEFPIESQLIVYSGTYPVYRWQA